jgi:hypothetical protein
MVCHMKCVDTCSVTLAHMSVTPTNWSTADPEGLFRENDRQSITLFDHVAILGMASNHGNQIN